MTNLGTVISRVLAVVGLAAATVAVIMVIGSATGGDDDGTRPKKAVSGKKQAKKPKAKAKKYTVQEGDSLSAIADRTGVSVDRIERLNPDLDPQALTIGQQLKLR